MSGSRIFYTVWAGQLISQVGSAMTGFALTIFIYQDTGSVTKLAMMLLAVNLPGTLLAPVAGVWIDRVNRRTVMLLADSVAGVGTLTLAILIWQGGMQYWQVLCVAIILSASGAFQEPAYRAALPTLVEKEKLGKANGLVEMAPALGTLVAPAIAGGLLLTIGIEAVLAIDFLTFLVAAFTLFFVRFPDVASTTERSSVWNEFQEGLSYLRARGGLLGLLWIYAGVNLALTLSNVLWIPVFLAFTNEAGLGTLMSTIGLAMVAGSVIMSAWGGPKRMRLVIADMLLMAIAGGFLAFAGLRPNIWWAGGGALGLMLLIPITNGISQTIWQKKVKLDFQGRVFSVRRMIASIATPIGFVAAGPLADRVFEPTLLEGGRWVDTLGPIFDVGVGRGSAVLITLTGLAVIGLAMIGIALPKVRNLELDIPDAIPDSAPAG